MLYVEYQNEIKCYPTYHIPSIEQALRGGYGAAL